MRTLRPPLCIGVVLRVYDTRVFHDFRKPYLLREFTMREESFDSMRAVSAPEPLTLCG